VLLHPALSFFLHRPPPRPPLFPYTTLFRSRARARRRSKWPPWRLDQRGATPRAAARATTCRDSWPGRSRPGRSHRPRGAARAARSEEHTSELQSRGHLVCRLLLEKKKKKKK